MSSDLLSLIIVAIKGHQVTLYFNIKYGLNQSLRSGTRRKMKSPIIIRIANEITATRYWIVFKVISETVIPEFDRSLTRAFMRKFSEVIKATIAPQIRGPIMAAVRPDKAYNP